MESRPFTSRVPDQSLVVAAYYPETDYITATRGEGYAFVYFPTGWPAEIVIELPGADKITAWWFDPRNGGSELIETFTGTGTRKFTPPSSGRGNDWILVLDDASKGYRAPGL